MSISTVQSTMAAAINTTRSALQQSSSESAGGSFAKTLASISNGTGYTDDEVKNFFAGNPNNQQIASKAASLGLNEGQILQAMLVGGYGNDNGAALKTGVESFVSDASKGYAWDANGVLVAQKSSAQGVAATSEKAMPATQDIRSFYATNPSDQQITDKAKALGLNAAQLVQFQATGIGMNMNQVSAPVLESMYVDAASRLGTDIGGGKNGGWTSYFSPTLGRAVTKSEIQTFFSGNPSQRQIFQKAADLGIGVGAVNNMMVGAGITKPESANKAYNQMDIALYQGADGYSLDQYGHIVSGGGNTFVLHSDGVTGTWTPKPPGSNTANETA